MREALRIQSGYFGVHDNDAWIDELLANLGLADKADANMRQLSGGMKRRVLVAQALVHRPPVIVLDEPTAGVDVELRQTLWQFVARLNKEGHTVLLTTHYLEEAEALCGRIAMLKQGRVVALDRTSALLAGTASTMLRFKLDKPLPPALRRQLARHRPHRPDHGARRARGRVDPRRRCTPPAATRKTSRSAAPTSRTCSSRSCAARRRRGWRHERPAVTAVPAVKAETGVLAGTRTLLYKEVLRFWKVSFQTVAAPVLTAVLYLLIFGHVLEGRVTVFGSVGYTSFLIPGLVMMSVLQNAFANSSSSLIQSKITGNLVFLLVTPLSHWAWFLAYVGASVVRGVAVGLGVLLVTIWFAPLHVANPLWIVFFTVAGAALMGALGLIAGLWAEKFDQIAAFQNFIIMPMTFLSGVFYSVQSLPPIWREVSHLNPFFYMIDGFRHGFFGTSDVSPWLSLAIVSAQPGGGVRDLPAPAADRLQDPPLNSRAATERAKPRAGGRLPLRLRRSPQAATALRCSVFEPAA